MIRPEDPSRTSRRRFLASSTNSVLAGAAAANLAVANRAYPGGSDLLRVGLVGCGRRGTGAATQALAADPNVKLTAMADAFDDHIESSLENLKKEEKLADKIDVPKERQFVGFDAYKQLLGSGVDVVLLATPPHFRPLHIRAAIEAGKHVFAEKPIAVDAPGCRSVVESCELAKQKKLSVVSGLCLRYSYGFQETVKRIHDGAIGKIVTLLANDYRGSIWVKPRQPEWSDMEWQMRNWYYFTWLSGDFNVEQHVHFLDVCAWVMNNAYPASAVAMGGRMVRNSPEFGNIYDHFSVTYEYDNGVRLFSNCRQQSGCHGDMSAHVLGATGTAQLNERRNGLFTQSESRWVYRGERNNFYQTEHDELFASIRNSKPINNGEYMVKSTMLAIMGRMSAYTGKRITWDQAWKSKEDLTPPKYAWGPLATPAVPMPGITKFA